MFEKPKHRTSAKKSYSGANQRERSPTLKASERKEGASKTLRAHMTTSQTQSHGAIGLVFALLALSLALPPPLFLDWDTGFPFFFFFFAF